MFGIFSREIVTIVTSTSRVCFMATCVVKLRPKRNFNDGAQIEAVESWRSLKCLNSELEVGRNFRDR